MGWDIEVAAVRRDSVADAVPEVFAQTGTTMDFQAATSSQRAPGLCAAQVGEWIFVVDTACRLSGATDHLAKISRSTDVHVVRIAPGPIALHYHDGRLTGEARGLAACLRLAPRADADGELCAMELLALQTGVLFHQDLCDVSFRLYT